MTRNIRAPRGGKSAQAPERRYSSPVRNTPATWPGRSVPPTRGSGEARHYSLVYRDREIPLARGEFVIGRSRSCDLVVQDMLVSRRHARLLVSKDALFVEDLGTPNGVYVNEMPVAGAVPLRDGDRLLVGTQEISVSASPDISDRETAPPPANVGPRPPAPLTEREMPIVEPSPPPQPVEVSSSHPGFDGEETQRTEKQDGLLVMARLADRMISMGRKEAAVRLLDEHFLEIASKARQGRVIPPDVLETVGYYGMKLADFTRDGKWADLALEIHTLARRPLPLKAIDLLEADVVKLPSFDPTRLSEYQRALHDGLPQLSPAERALVERISQIVPG